MKQYIELINFLVKDNKMFKWLKINFRREEEQKRVTYIRISLNNTDEKALTLELVKTKMVQHEMMFVPEARYTSTKALHIQTDKNDSDNKITNNSKSNFTNEFN